MILCKGTTGYLRYFRLTVDLEANLESGAEGICYLSVPSTRVTGKVK